MRRCRSPPPPPSTTSPESVGCGGEYINEGIFVNSRNRLSKRLLMFPPGNGATVFRNGFVENWRSCELLRCFYGRAGERTCFWAERPGQRVVFPFSQITIDGLRERERRRRRRSGIPLICEKIEKVELNFNATANRITRLGGEHALNEERGR